jgi:hypothetical protein
MIFLAFFFVRAAAAAAPKPVRASNPTVLMRGILSTDD